MYNLSKKNRRKKDGFILKIFEAIVYISIVHFSYILTFKFELFAPYDERNIKAYESHMHIILFFTVVILFLNKVFRTIKKSKIENIIIMLISSLMIAIVATVVAFLFRNFALPRSAILQTFFMQWLFFSIFKILFLKFIRKKRGVKDILVLTNFKKYENIAIKILSDDENLDRIKYVVDPINKKYINYIKKSHKILIASDLDIEIKNKIISKCISMNKSIYIVPETFEIAIYNSNAVQFSDYLAFRIDTLELSLEKRVLKRVMDIVLSLIGIILASPIMILTSIAIFITDGCPVFFTQKRATINNKIFNLLKFRTMVKDAEKDTGAIWAKPNDERITKTGRFLRRYWIDELPQLFNVLIGHMSMVGPRPERPVFVKTFSEKVKHFEYRMAVKAGVTGLAQVQGKYSTTPENKIKFDLMYIRKSSIAFDIRIMFDTLKKIFVGSLKRGLNEEKTMEELAINHNFEIKKSSNVIEFIYK